jgi:hypothetical protein
MTFRKQLLGNVIFLRSIFFLKIVLYFLNVHVLFLVAVRLINTSLNLFMIRILIQAQLTHLPFKLRMIRWWLHRTWMFKFSRNGISILYFLAFNLSLFLNPVNFVLGRDVKIYCLAVDLAEELLALEWAFKLRKVESHLETFGSTFVNLSGSGFPFEIFIWYTCILVRSWLFAIQMRQMPHLLMWYMSHLISRHIFHFHKFRWYRTLIFAFGANLEMVTTLAWVHKLLVVVCFIFCHGVH